jgi:hypothetical protein
MKQAMPNQSIELACSVRLRPQLMSTHDAVRKSDFSSADLRLRKRPLFHQNKFSQ